MGLKLEKGLKHQSEAVDRINRVFENVSIFNRKERSKVRENKA